MIASRLVDGNAAGNLVDRLAAKGSLSDWQHFPKREAKPPYLARSER